jgi:hypothetical protein
MKIVKVVHESSDENSEVEKQQFTIQNYDVNDFLKRSAPFILAKHFGTPPFLLTTPALLIPIMIASGPSKLENIREVIHKGYLPMADAVVKESVDTLLKDIIEHLNNSEVITLETARSKYPKTNNLSVGTYTLHPYNSQKLTRLEHFYKNLALEKDDELIVLLGRMGAKSVRIMEIDTQQKTGTGSLKTEGVVFDARADVSLSKTIERSSGLLVTFEGNVVDIKPNLLETSLWFSTDSRLNAIFESRRFNPNKIQQYTLVNTYTETFDFDFDLAAKYLVIAADLKAEYHSISKKE